MRLLILSILFVFLSGLFGSSHLQDAAVRNADPRSPKAELELTTRIVERKYCSGGGMLLILRTIYKNTGGASLILFKYNLAPFELRFSRNIEAARAKRYQQVISPMMGSSSGSFRFADDPPTDYFVVLKPGQSYTPVNNVNVPVFVTAVDRTASSKDYLGLGEHALQVNISTWPFDNGAEAELHTKWQRFGTLWTKPVLSLPMLFKVDRSANRSLLDCNAPATPKREAMP